MQEMYATVLDPKVKAANERFIPKEDLKEIHIRPMYSYVTKLGSSLSKAEGEQLVAIFRSNDALFTWVLTYMSGWVPG